MGVSQKYRTFNQLMEDVSVDFSNYALEGMIEPAQLIKVAQGGCDLRRQGKKRELCFLLVSQVEQK